MYKQDSLAVFFRTNTAAYSEFLEYRKYTKRSMIFGFTMLGGFIGTITQVFGKRHTLLIPFGIITAGSMIIGPRIFKKGRPHFAKAVEMYNGS